MSFTITGTGKSVPAQIVTNDMLTDFLDTSDEWITERTGIKTRHIIENESLLEHAAEAAKEAISDAGVTPDDIDAVICSTLQGDFVSPSLSCLLSKEVGIKTGRMLDVNMGCCGFVYALDAADSYIMSGRAEKVLVVCAEHLTKMADWTDRGTCVLFGDGAGAVVVEKSDTMTDFVLDIDGNSEPLNILGYGSNCPYSEKADRGYLKMSGQEIFKFAVSSITTDIKNILKKNSLTVDDISHFVLHQANMRIISFAQQRLKLSDEKVPHNVEEYGNTSSASIPLVLDDLNKNGKLEKGAKIVLSAFGAGLSRGACVIEWGK